MPKFKVKMSWLDTYEKVIDAPTKEEAIAEADGGDWGEPLWGGEEVETTAEEINDQQSHSQQRTTAKDTDTMD